MKHSAYRSMTLAKQGKTITKGGLREWINEDWRNLAPVARGLTTLANAPKCGDPSKNKPGDKSICRPLKRVNNNTPPLAKTYTKAQLLKALEIKNQGKTINWRNL